MNAWDEGDDDVPGFAIATCRELLTPVLPTVVSDGRDATDVFCDCCVAGSIIKGAAKSPLLVCGDEGIVEDGGAADASEPSEGRLGPESSDCGWEAWLEKGFGIPEEAGVADGVGAPGLEGEP